MEPKDQKDLVEQGLEKYRRKMVGSLIRPQQGHEVATKDAIRHFANGLGDPNPLWRDEEYAKNSIHGELIAPPFFLNAISEGQAIVGLPGLTATFVGSEWEWFKLIRVNDRFSVTNQLLDLKDLGSGQGRGRFLQSGLLSYTNQRDELVGRCTWRLMRTETKPGLIAREEPKKERAEKRLQGYSEEDLAAIYAAIEAEEIRGGNPRTFEEVNPGEILQPVVKGPLSISDMVAWAIGTGWHRIELAHGMKWRYLKANPGLSYIDPDTGAPEPIANSHFLPSAAKILMGSSLPIDLGFQRVCWLGHVVTNWMSDYGFLKKLEARLKGLVQFGDTTWCQGKVTQKTMEGKEYLVELELFCNNQHGEITATGKAVVALPSK
ncbi:MAG: MaoC family dehydratase N-terminal domain-containing protein [Pseudomonadota bacterium]